MALQSMIEPSVMAAQKATSPIARTAFDGQEKAGAGGSVGTSGLGVSPAATTATTPSAATARNSDPGVAASPAAMAPAAAPARPPQLKNACEALMTARRYSFSRAAASAFMETSMKPLQRPSTNSPPARAARSGAKASGGSARQKATPATVATERGLYRDAMAPPMLSPTKAPMLASSKAIPSSA